MMDRRRFLTGAGALAGYPLLKSLDSLHRPDSGTPDYSLRIEPCTIEIAPGITVQTTAFNGQVPGPILRLQQGKKIAIDVTNGTSDPDLTHWHGLRSDVRNDGAMEEGSPMIAPGQTLRYELSPSPFGTRWYHTHNSAMDNLKLGTYSGQFGFLIVEGGPSLGDVDQEFFLAIHHWEPKFVPMSSMMQLASSNQPATSGSDVAYEYATVNSHCLGAGEPLRVKRGQRVMLHLLNASATENVVLALPGHKFTVVAMDGNPVPHPAAVETLTIAVAERIDCIVEMDHPGVWLLGSILPEARKMGLGVVVEYAGSRGNPVWKNPADTTWDYRKFGNAAPPTEPDASYRLDFIDIGPQHNSEFDSWTVNGKSWPDVDPLIVHEGKRYRLQLNNLSGDQHPIHLHRHSFEIASIGGVPTSGIMKDTVNMLPMQQMEVDFIADNPGDTLYHCHMQLHMDFGFMGLVKYA